MPHRVGAQVGLPQELLEFPKRLEQTELVAGQVGAGATRRAVSSLYAGSPNNPPLTKCRMSLEACAAGPSVSTACSTSELTLSPTQQPRSHACGRSVGARASHKHTYPRAASRALFFNPMYSQMSTIMSSRKSSSCQNTSSCDGEQPVVAPATAAACSTHVSHDRELGRVQRRQLVFFQLLFNAVHAPVVDSMFV